MIDWVTVSSTIATSTIVCSALVWFCREWISARLKKSIQHEYDTKLEGYKAGYQKFLDENRITFSLWHESQAKAIKETYSEIAKLCVAIDLKIHCMGNGRSSCQNCDPRLQNTYKNAKNSWEYNKIFFDDSLNQQISEIFSISFDIKTTANQMYGCIHQRQNNVIACQQNKTKLDAILLELRKQLQQIMSGGRTNA